MSRNRLRGAELLLTHERIPTRWGFGNGSMHKHAGFWDSQRCLRCWRVSAPNLSGPRDRKRFRPLMCDLLASLAISRESPRVPMCQANLRRFQRRERQRFFGGTLQVNGAGRNRALARGFKKTGRHAPAAANRAFGEPASPYRSRSDPARDDGARVCNGICKNTWVIKSENDQLGSVVSAKISARNCPVAGFAIVLCTAELPL